MQRLVAIDRAGQPRLYVAREADALELTTAPDMARSFRTRWMAEKAIRGWEAALAQLGVDGKVRLVSALTLETLEGW